MDIEKLFNTFRKEAFRLECLPEYMVDSESWAFAKFNRTGLIPDGLNTDWLSIVCASANRSASIRRLRLLTRVPNAYERFELAAYRQNIKAGEDIRFAYIDEHKPQQDFWIFDMRWIAFIDYDKSGRFLGIKTEEASPRDIKNAKRWKMIFENAPSIASYSD